PSASSNPAAWTARAGARRSSRNAMPIGEPILIRARDRMVFSPWEDRGPRRGPGPAGKAMAMPVRGAGDKRGKERELVGRPRAMETTEGEGGRHRMYSDPAPNVEEVADVGDRACPAVPPAAAPRRAGAGEGGGDRAARLLQPVHPGAPDSRTP